MSNAKSYEWLADQETQAAVYQMVRSALARVQPDELDVFEGLFANYITLAREGDVRVDADTPFGLAGADDLMVMVLIPLAVDILGAVFIAAGAWSLKAVRDAARRQASSQLPNAAAVEAAQPVVAKTTPNDADIRQAVQPAVAKLTWLSAEQRQELEGCFVEVLQQVLGVQEQLLGNRQSVDKEIRIATNPPTRPEIPEHPYNPRNFLPGEGKKKSHDERS